MPAEVADSTTLPGIELLVEAGDWPPPAKLRALAGRAVAAAIVAVRLKFVEDSELSLVFTDDARIRVLNRQYRGKNSPTNVLSFPAPRLDKARFGPLLGDLVFAAETIAREAAADGISLDDHLTHLIVHGFLHLVGYDHEDDADAAVMEKLETAILGRLGIADPYGGGAG